MKKLLTLLFIAVLTLSFSHEANAQEGARKQLNFGFLGVTYEIPVSKDITIAPFAGTDWDIDWITFGVKGNYYFDRVFKLESPDWDVYGGLSLGYAVGLGNNPDSSDVGFGAHAGGRWFFNEKWGLFLELGGGTTGGTAGIGFTMKL
ncbi:hypothetical protein [Urechidicola vernalis]|uniref:Outer membrane protein beta-barrel domain-containing protein n=1 Tax=Urechidicola vernalis TaxID=3075600 RepID=A0ABU2Y3K1_9FLAO|nr:hypothetical protein [Urechidicola sp. P050]MDT0552783.1 hypothetical protein [Urechidicola sp. P050]